MGCFNEYEFLNIMNSYTLFSTSLSAVLFLSVCVQVLRGKPQNFASWILWTTLTGVAAATLIAQGGNYSIALAYTIGNGAVSLCILKSRSFSWTRLENVVTVLVLICLVVWAVSGARAATIATTCAFLIAGMPQLKDTYRKPRNTSVFIYAGYSVASSFSVLSGKDWSVEQRLFPVALVVLNSSVALVAARKFWMRENSRA